MDQVSLPLHRLPPDPHVEAAHQGDREVEGQHRTEEGHHLVGLQELNVAVLLVVVALALNVGPGVYWRDPHYTGESPGAGYQHDGLHGGPGGPVGEGPGDGEVSVHGDDDQVPDTGVAGEVVDGEPGVTEMTRERPALHDELHGEQWHGEGADDEVGQGQREEEVVRDGLELLVYLERHHHHDVADYREKGDHAGHDSNEGGLDVLVG